MKTTEESILTAMDCTDREILPHLPYILQDFWEIGSEPNVMITLVKKHLSTKGFLEVLDLGCGKGAVSINIAKTLNCKCLGIDAIPDFITYARQKAKDLGISSLCKFEVGDIRESIKILGQYDVIILGAIGQVFGNYYQTLLSLSSNLKDNGIIVIDDGYTEDLSKYKQDQVLSRSEMLKQISDAGMLLIDEVVSGINDNKVADYDMEYKNILKRCQELCNKFPDQREIFTNYSNQQKNEYEILKDKITCSTMVLKRKYCAT